MRIPKLVVFDVDGTLIDWAGSMPASATRSLAQLRTLDIPIALATGRPWAIAEHTLQQVGGADWMACGNGSVLFDVATRTLLRDRSLPPSVVLPIITGIRERVPGVGFAVELRDSTIEEAGFARRVPEPSTLPPINDVIEALPADLAGVRRLIPFHDDYDHRLGDLAAIVEQVIDHRCQVQFGGLPIIDISPSGDNKASAMQVLADHLGVAAADVLAFGDAGNDLEMLRWAGTGVAMGNSGPHVQAAADHVTLSVEDDGVAAFLDPLLAPHL